MNAIRLALVTCAASAAAVPERMRRMRPPRTTVGVGGWNDLDYGNLTTAIRDVVVAMTVDCTLAVHSEAAADFLSNTIKSLHGTGVTTTHHALFTTDHVQSVLTDIRRAITDRHHTSYIVFSTNDLMEKLLTAIQKNNLTSRNVVYVFLWLRSSVSRAFRAEISEAIRVCVITSPRPGFYQIYYSQATANVRRGSELKMINWWSTADGLVRFPLLPPPKRVYTNFEGRHFVVPVLHKPPWTFVEYFNDSFRVDGGRDVKLIKLLADKMNFRFTYIDPPDRTQGSGLDLHGSSMQGVLGLIWQRQADWFVGDLSITYERNLLVDFSFLTLVDNEAFLTHAPGRLNEAFSLIRPFHWSVWPLLLITVISSGLILYILIDSTDGHPRGKSLLYWKCAWWSIAVFLQQSVIIPSHNSKVRFVAGLLMLTATYVIGDMYSASLTSILARPPKEPPINTLNELAGAMRNSGLQLLVEVQSASQAMLEVRIKMISMVHSTTDIVTRDVFLVFEMSSSRRERVERDWRLRRAVRAGVPPTRISNRVDRERDAAGQGQQELRGHRRPGDFLLRHKTIRCSTFPSERKTEHEILGHRVSTSVSVQREFRRRADAAVRGRHPVENHRGGVPEAQRQPDRVGETGRADARGRRTGVGGRRGPATRRRRQTGHHSHVDEDPAGRVLRVGDRLDRGRPVPVDRDQIVRHVQQRQTDKTRTSPSPVRLRVARRR